MGKRRQWARFGVRSGVGAGEKMWPAIAACAAALLSAAATAHGGRTHENSAATVERSHPDRLPERPTLAPAFSIPVEPLGFSPPGQLYLGQRWSLASLDFLDENRLLFTFRVPGLIHRQARPRDDDDADNERHIKALVLSLPRGNVEAEAVWPLHDRFSYLRMTRDGRFLIRDRDQLLVGDASLELKPYLRFPGPVMSLDLDPEQGLIVTNSREPAATANASNAGAGTNVAADHEISRTGRTQPDTVLRILHRDSGKVMRVSRVRSAVHLPINSDGYLELLPGQRADWVVMLNSFSGGSTKLGQLDSTCAPSYEFVSQREFLVTTCNRQDVRVLTAMDTDGRRLWEDVPSSSPVWPLYVVGGEGTRIARESLVVNHPVTTYSPLSFDDVKGQLVEVFDAATGKIVLAAPASPILDGGGNVAISPSGKRAAVLYAGAIQVFELPEPTMAPQSLGVAQASKSGP